MFYCLCIGFTGLTLMSLWKVDDRYDKNIKYDAAIMLTGVIKPGDSISIGDTDYDFSFFRFTSVSKRLVAGIGFVKTGHAKFLLFGNCFTKNYDEGPIIRKFAEYQGLKEDEIKIYGDIRRTVDEANGVKEFLEENKYKNVILITSEMHMRRALAMFNKVGIFPDSYSVDRTNFEINWKDFIPTGGGARRIKAFLYELFGYVGYYLKGDI